MLIKGIYVITDVMLRPDRSHLDIARASLEGGASVIQLRDKEASDAELIPIARAIRRLAAAAGALFIVNDRLDVALAADADGLHVGQGDRPAKELRALIGGKILGVSAANIEEARRAREDGADYLGYGPVYSTATKSDAGAAVGLEEIAPIRSETGLPIVAIGGIGEANLIEVARSGADSAAVISAVVCAKDMVEATRRLVGMWLMADG